MAILDKRKFYIDGPEGGHFGLKGLLEVKAVSGARFQGLAVFGVRNITAGHFFGLRNNPMIP